MMTLKKTSSPQELEYFSIHIDRYKYILKTIDSLSLPKKSSILDVGCYPPYLLDALTSQGYNLSGISSHHESLKRKNVFDLNIEKEKFPFKDNTFDLIVFTEVLEHLIGDPLILFSEFRRILKPHGTLLLTTPNVLRTQNLINLLIGNNIYFPMFQLKDSDVSSGSIYYRHNREYTCNEIYSLLQQSDFKKIKSDYFISYTPFRQKNSKDSVFLKIVKYINYFLMKLLINRRDTLLFLASK